VSLRICYVVPGFCADEDDWCIPVLRNVIAQMAARHDVVVYTPHYPFRRSTYHAFGATVHCLSDRKERGMRRILLWEELRRRIDHDHARRPFDIIHAFWASEPGFLATAIARRLGIPSIVSIGGGELAEFPKENYGSQLSAVQRFFVRNAFARAGIITAGSRWVARKVPEEFQQKVREIPLGVETRLFTAGRERRGAHLLAVSSFIALKDYPTLLRAVAMARKAVPSITLDIAGDGVERPLVERMIGELRLADCTRLLGECRHEMMPEIYRSASLLLHSSLYESQGMVILEALATGLPVVASNVGIAAELPDDLLCRFEPRDADAMAAAIVRSLSSADHKRAPFTEGPALIRERYSVEGQCGIFERLYEEMRA
jgi:glycosyltransferase involved in cell wall biosynthesis